jgi:hypothetical protein
VSDVLTIAKLSRWSINYYNDTAKAVDQAAKDAQKGGGGLGEYYTEHDTRTPHAIKSFACFARSPDERD